VLRSREPITGIFSTPVSEVERRAGLVTSTMPIFH